MTVTESVREARAQLAALGLVDPTHQVTAERRTAPRLDTVAGKRGALLDNRKGNADRLLQRIGELLVEEHGVDSVDHVSKFIYSRRAEPELLDRIAADYDFVVAAVGD